MVAGSILGSPADRPASSLSEARPGFVTTSTGDTDPDPRGLGHDVRFGDGWHPSLGGDRGPVEEMFAVLTDVERTGSWFPGDVEEHWVTPPPHGIGSIRRAIVRVGGRTSENDAVVVLYDPPRLAAMRGLSKQAPFLATLRFGPTSRGMRVEVDIELNPQGSLRLVGPLFAHWYGRQWAQGLATLKHGMEAGTVPGG